MAGRDDGTSVGGPFLSTRLAYASASSYWCMFSMMDPSMSNEEDYAVLFGQADRLITGIGYAIGHYAQWLNRGAVRSGDGSDRCFGSQHFGDQLGRLVMVFINNAASTRSVDVALTGVSLAGTLTGEQSTASGYWQPMPAFPPTTPTTMSLVLPAMSVTTVAQSATTDGGVTTDAGAAEDGGITGDGGGPSADAGTTGRASGSCLGCTSAAAGVSWVVLLFLLGCRSGSHCVPSSPTCSHARGA